jgi:uncharacterized protein
MAGDTKIFADILVQAITITLMLVGLISLFIPILPGLVIIWVAALGYGLYAGFGVLGWVMFGIMSVLMITGSVVDNILMGTRAHKHGAAWWAILIALAAAILGSFLIPIPVVGGVVSALLALFLVEYARRKNAAEAWKAVRGMMEGCGWAVVVRFIMGLVMIGLWMIWAWV